MNWRTFRKFMVHGDYIEYVFVPHTVWFGALARYGDCTYISVCVWIPCDNLRFSTNNFEMIWMRCHNICKLFKLALFSHIFCSRHCFTGLLFVCWLLNLLRNTINLISISNGVERLHWLSPPLPPLSFSFTL